MEVTDEQIIKKLAEFDGYKKVSQVGNFISGILTPTRGWVPVPHYTKSLDACISPLEKLGGQTSIVINQETGLTTALVGLERPSIEPNWKMDKSPSLALSTAIYSVLIEREKAK